MDTRDRTASRTLGRLDWHTAEAADALLPGPLKIARYRELFALAMAQLAYGRDNGPEIACRIERFKSCD